HVSFKLLDWKTFPLKYLSGKTVLIVNVASKCGFTKQYDALEALYKKYKDKGFEIVGFPCGQFAKQEFEDDSEIQSFCRLKFGVSFPVLKRIDVNGKEELPLYTWLKSQKGGVFG
ncbi:Glutathione peroxidase like protein, partial [Aduncisulcus paluster]